MTRLSLERAKEILPAYCTEEHLLAHAVAVSAAMGTIAAHFGEDEDYWQSIGYLHDVDYQQYPEEHLQHTKEILSQHDVDAEDIRAILSHGWQICSDVEPKTNLEKALYAVDELTGIVMATARMRPTGISDLEVKSVMKKFKDKSFAAKCDRDIIRNGADILGMELAELMALTIDGMRKQAANLGL